MLNLRNLNLISVQSWAYLMNSQPYISQFIMVIGLSDSENRTTAKRESDLLSTSMITD